MKCPKCGSTNSTVTGYPPSNADSTDFYRYRKCLMCGKSFKTREFYVPNEQVQKLKGNRKERGII